MDTDYIVVEEAALAVEQANSIEFHTYHRIWTQKQLERHS